MTRLDSRTLVSALIRRVEGVGGFATVLQKGDPGGGVILVQTIERGRFGTLLERMTDLDGKQTMVPCGPHESGQGTEINEYILRRRRSDPDLWLVELDVAEAERFAAEILCAG